MLTIGQLCKRFRLARSTLIYYDKLGLLQPSGRSEANYRLYTDADIKRLEQICRYREAGVQLKEIIELLEGKKERSVFLLEQRLMSINQQMSDLRAQQQSLLQLLDKNSLLRESKTMTKQQWVDVLRAAGMSDEDMRRWHIEFERQLPEMHTDFLQSLGIEAVEIERIKTWSKLGQTDK